MQAPHRLVLCRSTLLLLHGAMSVSTVHSGACRQWTVLPRTLDAGRLEGIPSSASGPQTSFSGPMASGGGGSVGTNNFDGQQVLTLSGAAVVSMSAYASKVCPCHGGVCNDSAHCPILMVNVNHCLLS